MKVRFYGDVESITAGIQLLSTDLGFEIAEDGYPIEVTQRKGSIEVRNTGEKGEILFEEPIHFFRGLGLWFEKQGNFEIIETPQFKTTGAMMDQSRNAVLTVASVKKLIRNLALMGMNMLMLYTEDVYEVKERPYFGYMRGRYTEKELKELDDYAFNLGIEMIPCIQTLAHLKQTLKWNYAVPIRDNEDILLVNEPKTYEFIEEMIVAATKPFRTKRIHIGMDEAFQLGLGNYLKKNGYQERFDIMNQHLQKVVAITEKYNLKPMIWSDMYFRIGSKTGAYYDLEVDIPTEVIESIPKNSQLVYWDYYHADENFYREFINRHQALGSQPIFAGGVWTWNGIAPNYGKGLTTSEAALRASKKEGVEEVFATVWGDNGAETPQSTALPVLQLYAEHAYHEIVDYETLPTRFKTCTGGNYEEFLKLTHFDETPGAGKDNPHTYNPSKFLLYQDILTGLYDKNIEGHNLNNHYAELAVQLKTSKSGRFQLLFNFYQALAEVLKDKAEIGLQLKQAYDASDKEMMQELTNKLSPLAEKANQLRQNHRKLWFSMYKPFGWEVIDIRYGGVLTRIDSAIYRLEAYLAGEIETLDELEQERLHFEGPYPMPEGSLGRNNYHQIVTAGDLG